MDSADLLEYALGRLDGPRREQIERQIATDPALAARASRLSRNLRRLLDDGREQGRLEGPSLPPSTTISPTRPGSFTRSEPGDQGDLQTSDSR